ncbi:MAG: ATPase [Flavobacteriales bacterium]|mgnify:CR=1 FL=1|nr:ATPase [Flavobacteriales bacterium]
MNKSIIRISYILIFSMFVIFNVTARTNFLDKEKTKFKVWGNCEMCNKTISNAAKSLDGVLFFKWNSKTKIATVKFDSDIISIEDIQLNISLSGYDTENFKAPDNIYNNLHYCCKYKRN